MAISEKLAGSVRQFRPKRLEMARLVHAEYSLKEIAKKVGFTGPNGHQICRNYLHEMYKSLGVRGMVGLALEYERYVYTQKLKECGAQAEEQDLNIEELLDLMEATVGLPAPPKPKMKKAAPTATMESDQ